MRKISILALSLLLGLFLAVSVQAADELMMATTTSTDNTGLLDYLKPIIEKDLNINLKWTAVGTGKALKMGENCDVDVLLVHAPAAEKTFVGNGFGMDRRELFFNDFVIIGPPSDPAGVKGMSVTDALKTIAAKKAVFVSRGDDSGTNKKEIALWDSAGLPVPDKEPWYIQTGQGMLPTINVAREKDGYTMTDRGTFIKYSDTNGGNPPLVVLVEGDAVLMNQYSIIPIDPKHCPKAKVQLAQKLSDWLAGPVGQKTVGDFRMLNMELFKPNAK